MVISEKWTDKRVQGLTVAPGEDRFVPVRDGGAGFGVRVRCRRKPGAAVVRSYVLRIRPNGGAQRRFLWNCESYTLKQAVAAASVKRGEVALGVNVPTARAIAAAERRQRGERKLQAAAERQAGERDAVTVQAALDRFLSPRDANVDGRKERTLADYRARLAALLRPVLAAPVGSVGADVLAKRFAAVSHRAVTHNRMRQYARTFFKWCRETGLTTADPVGAIPKLTEGTIPDTIATLTAAQIQTLLAAIARAEHKGLPRMRKGKDAKRGRWSDVRPFPKDDGRLAALRFLLATGCRPDEVERMAWGDVHEGAVLLTEHKSQRTGDTREILLNAPALRAIESRRRGKDGAAVFGASYRQLTEAWAALRLSLGWSEKVTLYAMRRTFATWADDASFSQVVIDAVQGRRAPKSDVFRRYARATPQGKVKVMAAWADFLTSLGKTSPPSAGTPVTPIRRLRVG